MTLSIKVPTTPGYDERRAKAEEKGYEACPVCGKAIKNAKHLVFSAYGVEYNDPKDFEAENGLVGYLPVGTECVKVMRAAGVPVFSAKDLL